MSREELAWAAGFFDGEGHTCSNKSGYPKIDIAQVNPASLHRLRDALGVGIISGPVTPRRGRPYYLYRVNGYERVQHAIASLWPWLGAEKREQATRVLLIARARPARREFHVEGAKAENGRCKRGHDKEGRRACRTCNTENRRRARSR